MADPVPVGDTPRPVRPAIDHRRDGGEVPGADPARRQALFEIGDGGAARRARIGGRGQIVDMAAAADLEVDEVLLDHEAFAQHPAGAVVTGIAGPVAEAVDKARALEPHDRRLRADGARGRTAAEGGAGHRPAAEAGLEILPHRVAGLVGGALRIGGEGGAVPVADEILRRGSAGDPAGVQVLHQKPLGLAGVLDRHLDQVGHLPDAADRAAGAEARHVAPGLQVGGLIELGLARQRPGDRHHPVAAVRVVLPEHLGIAELRVGKVKDRVSVILRPGEAAVQAEGQRLFLVLRLAVHRRDVRGVDRDDRRLAVRAIAEAGCVGVVDHDRAREDLLVRAVGQRDAQFGPRNQIGADRLAPGHVPPLRPFGVVLVEHVIDAVLVEQPVRVVQPVLLGRVVVDRAIDVAGRSHGSGPPSST